ncbi:TonB family protein [Desulfosarcina sp. OttesenSCG-928-B08]|nr:TonB family protein [Desulfosarcina sp. OttesenSCG-928-B08]
MNNRKSRKQASFFALNGKRLFAKTLVAAMVLHASVVFGLVRISAETEKPRFTPLAVMDFSPFDPEGGNPGSGPGEASPVPTPPASPPPEPVTEPEPEPSPAPDLVTTTSTKAVDEAPIPPKPEKKPEKKKDPKPKPKPKPVPVPQKKAPDPGPVLAGAEGQATGAGSGAEQGVPGGGTGTGTGTGTGSGKSGSGQGGVGGGTGRGNPDALKAYYGQIQKKLVRYKKYPRTAQMRHQEGVVTVFFVVGRSGKVVSSRIAKTSGHALLDEEVLALLKRVNPFPPIPKDITRDQLEMMQAIQFEIK